MHYSFGDMVVVEGRLVGLICKVWSSRGKQETWLYDVYVSEYSKIFTYAEPEIRRLRVPAVVRPTGGESR